MSECHYKVLCSHKQNVIHVQTQHKNTLQQQFLAPLQSIVIASSLADPGSPFWMLLGAYSPKSFTYV